MAATMSETTVNEWDAERLAIWRAAARGKRGAFSIASATFLSLLDALEEAREQRDALHEYLSELCGWLGEYRYGWEADRQAGSMAASERLRVLGNAQEALERIHAARAAGSWSLWNPND